MTLYNSLKTITATASHQPTDVESPVPSSEFQLLQTQMSLNSAQQSWAHLLYVMYWNLSVGALDIE
jgi:hypothetical protein